MPGKVVGIDLGTTYCAVAVLDERGVPTTVPNRDGDMLTPSAVLFADDVTAVVGRAALDEARQLPDRVATLVKRQMGRPSYGRPVAGRDFRPETLSAIILKKLAQDAAHHVGPIDKVVITVPAYFDDTRRKATKDAARVAGLDVLDIIDEPTAAALSYCFKPTPDGVRPSADQPLTVLVYDLGGGTFDVTLVRLTRHSFQTMAIEGDVRLGGRDWDERVAEHVAAQFKQKHGDDPRADEQSAAALYDAAERAKRNLSKLPQTSITCTHNGKMLTVPLTRAEFEDLTRFLLLRTRTTTQAVLKQAGVSWGEVDRVLLVGGSTHMPMTGRMLQELSGKKPDDTLAVSEVVARGAALHAGIVASRSEETRGLLDAGALEALEDVVEINVNAHSLGVEVRQGEELINDILIPKNTQLPAVASRVYWTRAENQTRVRVKVLQGEAHQAEACISVGECWIDKLPPNLPKGSPIQVRCSCESNGLIEVMALDMTSGALAHARIERTGGLTDEEIEREAAFVRSLTIL